MRVVFVVIVVINPWGCGWQHLNHISPKRTWQKRRVYSDYFGECLIDTALLYLTHWGRVTHICVGKQTIIGSDNGLSPGRRQAIIWTNAGILLIGSLGTNFNEISIKMLTFSFTKIRLKVSSAKQRPFCLGLNVLTPSWDTPDLLHHVMMMVANTLAPNRHQWPILLWTLTKV